MNEAFSPSAIHVTQRLKYSQYRHTSTLTTDCSQVMVHSLQLFMYTFCLLIYIYSDSLSYCCVHASVAETVVRILLYCTHV